jgi:basic membrane protein A
VKYVNPDADFITTFTGSFEDVGKMKETAIAAIEKGADIVMADAGQAGIGAIEAAQDKGVLAIGFNADQAAVAPDTVVVSMIKEAGLAVDFVIEQYLADTLEPKLYNLGVKEKIISLSPWHNFEDKVPSEVKEKLAEIINDLEEGRLDLETLPN